MRDVVRSALERLGGPPLSSAAEGTPLITTLAMVEGEILSYLERYGAATLRELTRTLDWSSRLVTMAVGGLVRERLVRAKEFDLEVVIELVDKPAALATTEEPVPEVWGG